MTRPYVSMFTADDDRVGVLSPRTPVLVRCALCLARFGEALGRPARPCPHCGETVRVLPHLLHGDVA